MALIFGVGGLFSEVLHERRHFERHSQFTARAERYPQSIFHSPIQRNQGDLTSPYRCFCCLPETFWDVELAELNRAVNCLRQAPLEENHACALQSRLGCASSSRTAKPARAMRPSFGDNGGFR